MAATLRTLNELLNRISHEYKTPLAFEEVHPHVAALDAAGVDFTDNSAASPHAARGLGYEDIFGLMHEATKHLLFELGFTLVGAGGDNLIAWRCRVCGGGSQFEATEVTHPGTSAFATDAKFRYWR